jgi:uncharacterized protein (UPF0264 family)
MTQLLVSVRSAAEAEAALAGGAALIDVKEPARGPLGMANDCVIAAVVRAVAGRCPVSAALGELRHGLRTSPPLPAGLRYLKWGLSQLGRPRSQWQGSWQFAQDQVSLRLPGSSAVLVAYADWQAADAPPVEEVCAFARQRPGGVFLIDTFTKAAGPDGRRPTLLDFLPPRQVVLLCKLCRAAEVRIALAGSLGPAEIERLLPARPDWFAVRGAACVDGERGGVVDAARVRRLAELVGNGDPGR